MTAYDNEWNYQVHITGIKKSESVKMNKQNHMQDSTYMFYRITKQ